MRVAANEASSLVNAKIRPAFQWAESLEIEWRAPISIVVDVNALSAGISG